LGHKSIPAADEVLLIGHNTDGHGLLSALRGKGESIEGARVVVLGAGGAARAAAMALAGRAGQVDVVNRRLGTARTLSLQLRAAGTQSRAAGLGTDDAREWLSQAQLVVQCTTVGMGTSESIIDGSLLGPKSALCDLVYAGAPGSPLGDTALLVAARARGLPVIDGIDVLVHQAIRSLELWLDRSGLDQLHAELRAAALGAALEVA
jgi:shikimate dehydrogenase